MYHSVLKVQEFLVEWKALLLIHGAWSLKFWNCDHHLHLYILNRILGSNLFF